jgi:predicted PurR-regulated permease PerM
MNKRKLRKIYRNNKALVILSLVQAVLIVLLLVLGASLAEQLKDLKTPVKASKQFTRAIPYQASAELETPGDIQLAGRTNLYQRTVNHWYLQGDLTK